MNTISLVLAMADNGVIGNGGGIPWRIADDMRRFKRLTMGNPVIMGRKTWQSLPKRPLPGRTNIVMTRDRAFSAEGAAVVHAFDAALTLAEHENRPEIMIIGGAEVYRAALDRAGRVHLTEVHAQFPGDTRMPPFDMSTWRETAREDHRDGGGLSYSYVTLERF